MQCIRLGSLFLPANSVFLKQIRFNKTHIEKAVASVKLRSNYFAKKTDYKKKPKLLGTVDIHKGMTYLEAGKSMNIPQPQIIDLVKRMHSGKPPRVTNPIKHVSRLVKFVRACGYQANLVKNDNDDDEEDIDSQKDAKPRPPSDPEKCLPRPPVVTIMGHVDHGKTTLLDALRASRIVESEFGGITQHIGAFTVRLASMKGEPRITFLDTPGHAAFSAMRQRGANCTDMVVLVVAADDGVMPQTLESIRFAENANVPILVAINKIDAPNADLKTVSSELVYKAGLVPESEGGEVQCVPISALKRQNLETLQEAIIVQAELMDLRAEMDGPAEAVILEAHTEKGRGKVATCLVQRGCMMNGAHLVAGTATCRVRAIFDEAGNRVKKALPSDPVEVIGWRELPVTGDIVLQVESETYANEVQKYRLSKMKEAKMETDEKEYAVSMSSYRERYNQWRELMTHVGNSLYTRRKFRQFRPQRDLTDTDEEEVPEVNLIIKGDVYGSVEAILDTIAQIQGSHLYDLNIVEHGVGAITESELQMAETFNAIIYSFNVPVNRQTLDRAAANDITIREFNVIYHLAHDVRDQVLAIIPPVIQEEELGQALVQEIFMVSREGSRAKVPIAGCFCETGVMENDASFRVYRSIHTHKPEDGEEVSAAIEEEEEGDDEDGNREVVVFDGLCESLYHKKKVMKRIKQNSECGIMLINADNRAFETQPGDRILCYRMVSAKRNVNIEFSFQ